MGVVYEDPDTALCMGDLSDKTVTAVRKTLAAVTDREEADTVVDDMTLVTVRDSGAETLVRVKDVESAVDLSDPSVQSTLHGDNVWHFHGMLHHGRVEEVSTEFDTVTVAVQARY